MIKITVSGTQNIAELHKRLTRMYQTNGGVNLTDAAEISRKAMIGIIEESRLRPQRREEDDWERKSHKHLAQSITMEAGKDFAIVGDIAKMDRETPYWAAINWGGYVPPQTRGTFSDGPPQAGKGKGKFIHRLRAGLMTPKKIVAGKFYIQKTMSYIEDNIYPFLLKTIKGDWENLSWKKTKVIGNQLVVR